MRAISFPPRMDGGTSQILVSNDDSGIWIRGHCPAPGVDPDDKEVEAIAVNDAPGDVYEIVVNVLSSAGYKLVPNLVFGVE